MMNIKYDNLINYYYIYIKSLLKIVLLMFKQQNDYLNISISSVYIINYNYKLIFVFNLNIKIINMIFYIS